MTKIKHKAMDASEMADCESLMRQANRFLRIHQLMLPEQTNRDLIAGHVMRTEGDTLIGDHLIPASQGDVIRESGSMRLRVFGQFGDMLANLANKFANGGHKHQYCRDDRFDNYYQEAVIGMNAAYFYYTNPSVKFITFSHTSVERRLIRYSKGIPLDPSGLIRNVKSKIRIISEISRDEETPLDIAMPESDFDESDLFSLREAVSSAEFTDLEQFVLDGFFRYGGDRGWAKKVAAESYNHDSGKPYTLSKITAAWDRVKDNLKDKMS